MIEGKELELLNFLWIALAVPGWYFWKSIRDKRTLEKEHAKKVAQKALESLSREEIIALIKEQLEPMIREHRELEDDFKQVNNNLTGFVDSIHTRITEVLLRLSGK